MQETTTMATALGFRPVSRILALEPRLLYDATAAVATEHQQDPSEPAHGDIADAHKAAAADGTHLLVIDGGLAGAQTLARCALPGTAVLVVAPSQDGVAAVSQALTGLGPVDSVQILSHGAPGHLTLGSSRLTAHSEDTLRTAAWAPHLSAGADLLIYGCATAGVNSALLDALANATEADVAASSNETGNAEAGGDWTLEVATGEIDSQLRITPEALAQFDDLLGLRFMAVPSLTLDGGSAEILVGGDARIQATITNPSFQAGYAPFIEILLPATGYGGDNGVSFVSGSTRGMALRSRVVTFDEEGMAEHPLAHDDNGYPVVLQASAYGYQPGDQMVVLEFPYMSLWQGQPTISVDVVLRMRSRADIDTAHHVSLRAGRAGIQHGHDPLSNPRHEPAQFEADWRTYMLRSALIVLTQSVDPVEAVIAGGENRPLTLTVTAAPAPGQTLCNVVVTERLSDSVRVQRITPSPGGVVTGLTLAGGGVLNDADAIATALAGEPFLESYEITYETLTGPSDMQMQYYVPETTVAGHRVQHPITAEVHLSGRLPSGTTGVWEPLSPRGMSQNRPLASTVGEDGGEGVVFFGSTDTEGMLMRSAVEPVLPMAYGIVSSNGGAVISTTGDETTAAGRIGAGFDTALAGPSALAGWVSGAVRLALNIENHGNSHAYDVVVDLRLPAGLAFLGGSLETANVRIVRGDGTLLVPGQDYRIAGTMISFLDANDQPALPAGRLSSVNGASGANIAVITYDVVAPHSLTAADTPQTIPIVSHDPRVEAGPDVTPVGVSDTADALAFAPVVARGFVRDSLHASDANLSRIDDSSPVVGERRFYDIVVTLRQGTIEVTLTGLRGVAGGDIIRYRCAPLVPVGRHPDAAIRVRLPAGLIFLNDGSATLDYWVGALSNGWAGLLTDRSGPIVSGTSNLNDVADETSPSPDSDLPGRRTKAVLSQSAIDTSDPRVVVLRLGHLVNPNPDPDLQALYFEFNVDVGSTAGVAAGGQRVLYAEFLNDMDAATERVLDPRIENLQKVGARVAGVMGYTITFGNTGSAAAHDLVVRDTLPPGGQRLTVTSLAIDGNLYMPGMYPAGVSVVVNGDTVTVAINRLGVGASVRLHYTMQLPDSTRLVDTNASVLYTDQPGGFHGVAAIPFGAAGEGQAQRSATRGNVLTNDVDDGVIVIAVRPQREAVPEPVGQPLAGRYGFIVMHSDGSYTYEIDEDNADVVVWLGQGFVLSDVFIYTITNAAGQQTEGQLTLVLDLNAQHVDANDPADLPDDEAPDRVAQVTSVMPESVRGERQLLAMPTGMPLASLTADPGQRDAASLGPAVQIGYFSEQLRASAGRLLWRAARQPYGGTMQFSGG